MLRTKNLIAVVAGSTGGLGSATCIKLMRLGARVVGLDCMSLQDRIDHEEYWEVKEDKTLKAWEKDVSWKEELDRFQEEGKFYPLKGDITSQKDVSDCMRKVEILRDEFGGNFNLAVNCAGVSVRMRLLGPQFDDFEDHLSKTIGVNVTGAFNFSRLAAQLMAQNKINDENEERGCIINTSGILGEQGMPFKTVSSASDGALNSMTLPMSRDLSSVNIRVNTIAPGYFKTNMMGVPWYRLTLKKSNFLGLLNAFPNRVGEVTEFADLVVDVFNNKMINGEVIDINAGAVLPP